MFAVIETGGKQYLVKEGSIIKVEKLEVEEKKEVEINKVICISNNGLSYSSNATVKAEVLEQCRGEKIIIFKKKRRKNYRRKTGHRQYITVLRINEINLQK
ncbi:MULTISPECIES: 50S ribosomal protein L21 [Rickettsiales]|uniref:Large ribosomal subunit protein bL21 n=1 Tax=Wolbachia pipientis TaxID=955 RepID=A0A6H2NUY7_WOLPI|nr:MULTISPECIES: 50S ribosomal protein L21 [Rickettsiales]MBV2146047.1 50S ribosomal protein L21 [Wolbachia endosymbiont of Pissodes strobi]MBC6685914.1 50S ribosomal protein L21 [Wolbachia pipientis]MDE5061178.1 50S ribosomal protein L21 [Wolbachia endosymbiont of Drosophila nikananu]MDE5062049.1 50S ribosomal protein L21 [Wolbachia endosymbiont of Drosophila tsacasi]QMV47340.1 50S ribosomal protein L21 [Wolbachia pipientis]